MEPIAVISDIHGNMPAFRAVLADIEQRGISRIFNLGDLAGKGPNGDQAIDLCRERCEIVIRGNWDEGLADPENRGIFAWYQNQLGTERCAYLRNLPFAHDFEMGGHRIRLVHASPQGNFHRVHQTGPDEPKLAMFENTEFTDPDFSPDVVGYADIHVAYMRTFYQQILFNVGSVGNPLDLTLASYVILDSTGPSSLGINFIRVAYDIEQALADARISGMPAYPEYEWELRTAQYRGVMPQHSAG